MSVHLNPSVQLGFQRMLYSIHCASASSLSRPIHRASHTARKAHAHRQQSQCTTGGIQSQNHRSQGRHSFHNSIPSSAGYVDDDGVSSIASDQTLVESSLGRASRCKVRFCATWLALGLMHFVSAPPGYEGRATAVCKMQR